MRAAVISLPATDAEFNDINGPFQPGGTSLGAVGASPSSDGVFQGEDSYAIQFNLAALPAGAPNIFAFGFAGNGAFSAASVTTGTQPFQTQAGNSGPVNYDVSAFVEGLSAGAYAGFSLRQESFGVEIPEGSFDTSQNTYSPLLTITYAVPASPVAEPFTIALLASGLLGLGLLARRRKAA